VPRTMEDALGLVVMGGPMGVYEEARYPFLKDEKRLIERALREGKPVLGVCLGSQLLAAALGSRVARGDRKEIGWHPVDLTREAGNDPLWQGVASPMVAYHWHGDVFDLPSGAVSLASTQLTECQAFRYGGSAYGFLFHMEVTQEIIRDMVETFSDELRDEGLDGRGILAEAPTHLPTLHRVGTGVFHRWVSLLDGGDRGVGR